MTRPDKGFTLIETLVSLFVIAMLATSGGILLLQTLRASAAVEARTADLEAMQIALSLMRDDFMNMRHRLPVLRDDTEQTAGFIGLEGEEEGVVLRFIRGGWPDTGRGAPRSDLQLIEYEIADGALIRKAWMRPDASSETPIVTRKLISASERIRFRYHDEREWRDNWLTRSGSAREGFPLAIEVAFQFSEDDTLTERFLTGAR